MVDHTQEVVGKEDEEEKAAQMTRTRPKKASRANRHTANHPSTFLAVLACMRLSHPQFTTKQKTNPPPLKPLLVSFSFLSSVPLCVPTSPLQPCAPSPICFVAPPHYRVVLQCNFGRIQNVNSQ